MSEDSTKQNTIPTTTSESDDWKLQRDACKLAGDQAFQTGDYASAIPHYSSAISLDPEFCVGYSNRSAAYLKKGDKSKALHDANKCVDLGSMGAKGISRQAAALQSLGRWQTALQSWLNVLNLDEQNEAAKKGVQDCQEQLYKEQKETEMEKVQAEQEITGGSDDAVNVDKDDLDDFFNDIDDATAQVRKEKEIAAEPQATDAIKKQKKSLGTAQQQIERLLKENYKWRNLNPFYVLDLPHTASTEEISRRFKGLSLLLHPDKNTTEPNAQEAYDEVLKAKAMLDDDNKSNHCRQLIEKGMIRGQAEWEQRKGFDSSASLEDFQSKAVQRIFAEIEHRRREVERRERQYEQRTQQQEDEEERKEFDCRKFDKEWKQEERVDKRIGNWRDFAKKKPKL
jgi:DnaJ family protein C protein 8